jgi:hypothetical protein
LRAARMSTGMSPTNSASAGSQRTASSVASRCRASGLRAPARSGPMMPRKKRDSSRKSRIFFENTVGLFVQTAMAMPMFESSSSVAETSSRTLDSLQHTSS